MKNACLVLLVVAVIVLLGFRAERPAPVGIVPAVVAAAVEPCRENRTATLSFVNAAAVGSSEAMNVELNGSRLDIENPPLQPGDYAGPIVVPAGIVHTVRFRYARNDWPACALSSPTPATCGSLTLTCAGGTLDFWRW
jgi:hypothetical protein